MIALLLWLGVEKSLRTLDFDVDGDGYSSDVDCDDDDAPVFPDAQEICDGVDNDCDALVDSEDDSLEAMQYADGDGDGLVLENRRCLARCPMALSAT